MIDCMNHLASLGVRPRAGDTAALSLDELLALGVANPLRAVGIDSDAFMRAHAMAAGGARVRYENGQFRLLGGLSCEACEVRDCDENERRNMTA